jgi:Icc protein
MTFSVKTAPFIWALLLSSLGASLLVSCELLEYSPNELRTSAPYRELTRQNLLALAARPTPPADDTLRFVLTGDSQRFYAEAQDLVTSINQQRNIAFVAVAGDISDFGLARELHWVHDKLQTLHVPYLTVIGNHDHAANGRQGYQDVYGPLNYSFVYHRTQFVFVDTNSREYDFNGHVPDLAWLRTQLADTVGVLRQVVLSHVPPMDGDFDPQLAQPYVQALLAAPKVMLALNGHRHDFSQTFPYPGTLPFINSYSFEKRQYVILTLWGQRHYRLETIAF